MPNPDALVGELEAMLAKATPELFNAKPERIAQMLRDGARAQRPLPNNINSFDGLADGALIVAAINALPTLLATLKAQREALEELANASEAEDEAVIKHDRMKENEAAYDEDELASVADQAAKAIIRTWEAIRRALASIEGNPTA